MKTSTEMPKIYDRLHKIFGVKWSDGIAIAYGDMVYSKNPVLDDVAAHEAVHIEQQKNGGAPAWWERYIADPEFRLDQEVQAYRAQVRWIRKNCKDRNVRFKRQIELVRDLASPMYGNLIDLATASRLLRI